MCKCGGGVGCDGGICVHSAFLPEENPRDWEGFPAESVNSKRGLGRGPDLAP